MYNFHDFFTVSLDANKWSAPHFRKIYP